MSQAWRRGAPYPPISTYALLSDCHSAALVARDGSIDWCCFPRFDARPVFSRVLDWSRGGHFRIAPTGHYYTIGRRYLPGTNVLETRLASRSGSITIVDCLAVPRGALPGDAAQTRTDHQLLRLIHCDGGEVEVTVEFKPRFDYGLTVPRVELPSPHVGLVYGAADALVLQSQIPLIQADMCGCGGTARLRGGDHAFVALTYSMPHRLEVQRLSLDQVAARIQHTIAFWQAWSARCTYQGPYREHVLRSALVLKALTHAPTGAIVAAPTTSLPDSIGGLDNRDHRYSFLRDTALNLRMLFTLGYTDEAHQLMAWLERTTAGPAEDLQSMYGVGTERVPPEMELGQLDGWRGSRPVRIGNAGSSGSFQPDTYGYLLDTAWLHHRQGGEISSTLWELLRGAVDVVAARWSEPDEGIWETRGAGRHFVSSKVMAWVAVDRAVRLARDRSLPADLDRWRALRAAIRQRVEHEGVDSARRVFVQSFGSSALDAANLLVPLVRFLPADDTRVLATLRHTADELTTNGLVYRYLKPDAPRGEAAASLICSFWLVDNLVLTGQVGRARELFERLLGYANDLGLLAQTVDPTSDELLGNFPHTFSHAGLIGAALHLTRDRPPTPARS